jgi:hypothetical protein
MLDRNTVPEELEKNCKNFMNFWENHQKKPEAERACEILCEINSGFGQGVFGIESSYIGVIVSRYILTTLRDNGYITGFDFIQTSDDVFMRIDGYNETQAGCPFLEAFDISISQFGFHLNKIKSQECTSDYFIFNSKVYTSEGDPVESLLRLASGLACPPLMVDPCSSAQNLLDTYFEIDEEERENAEKIFRENLVATLLIRGWFSFPDKLEEILDQTRGYLPSFVFGTFDIRGEQHVIHTSLPVHDVANLSQLGSSFALKIGSLLSSSSETHMQYRPYHFYSGRNYSNVYKTMMSLVSDSPVFTLKKISQWVAHSAQLATSAQTHMNIIVTNFTPRILIGETKYCIWEVPEKTEIEMPFPDSFLLDLVLKEATTSRKEADGCYCVFNGRGNTLDPKDTIVKTVSSQMVFAQKNKQNTDYSKYVKLFQEASLCSNNTKIYRFPQKLLYRLPNTFYEPLSRMPEPGETLEHYLKTKNPICPWVVAQPRNGISVGVFCQDCLDLETNSGIIKSYIFLIRDNCVLCTLERDGLVTDVLGNTSFETFRVCKFSPYRYNDIMGLNCEYAYKNPISLSKALQILRAIKFSQRIGYKLKWEDTIVFGLKPHKHLKSEDLLKYYRRIDFNRKISGNFVMMSAYNTKIDLSPVLAQREIEKYSDAEQDVGFLKLGNTEVSIEIDFSDKFSRVAKIVFDKEKLYTISNDIRKKHFTEQDFRDFMSMSSRLKTAKSKMLSKITNKGVKKRVEDWTQQTLINPRWKQVLELYRKLQDTLVQMGVHVDIFPKIRLLSQSAEERRKHKNKPLSFFYHMQLKNALFTMDEELMPIEQAISAISTCLIGCISEEFVVPILEEIVSLRTSNSLVAYINDTTEHISISKLRQDLAYKEFEKQVMHMQNGDDALYDTDDEMDFDF